MIWSRPEFTEHMQILYEKFRTLGNNAYTDCIYYPNILILFRLCLNGLRFTIYSKYWVIMRYRPQYTAQSFVCYPLLFFNVRVRLSFFSVDFRHFYNDEYWYNPTLYAIRDIHTS